MKKLGIILGSSIPAAILSFLVAIFFWIRRLKPKKRAPEVREQEWAKSSGVSEEGLANIAEEEEGEGGRGGGSGNSNKENASRLPELHSDPNSALFNRAARNVSTPAYRAPSLNKLTISLPWLFFSGVHTSLKRNKRPRCWGFAFGSWGGGSLVGFLNHIIQTESQFHRSMSCITPLILLAINLIPSPYWIVEAQTILYTTSSILYTYFVRLLVCTCKNSIWTGRWWYIISGSWW